MGPESRRRWFQEGVPIGAIILVLLGVVLLLQTTGILSWSLWANLWRFWPLILIAIGLNIILGRRAPWLAALLMVLLLIGALAAAFALASREAGQAATSVQEPLGQLESVRVTVAFGAGELKVGPLSADSRDLVEGHFDTPGRPAKVTLQRTGKTGDLLITMDNRRWFGGFSEARRDIAFSRTPRLSVGLKGGASTILLDLRDLQVTDLTLDVGAANVELTPPAHAGHVDVRVNAGASNVKVNIPEGLAGRITTSSGLSSFDVDQSRFPKEGSVYVSPDFGTATNRVSLDFRVGAASVKVR